MQKKILIAWGILAMVLTMAPSTSQAELADQVRSGNIFTFLTIPQHGANKAPYLVSLPFCGFDMTGSPTNTLSVNSAVAPQDVPIGTKLYFYENGDYTVYTKSETTGQWVAMPVVDGDTGEAMQGTLATQLQQSQGATFWVEYPQDATDNHLNVFGQYTATNAVSPTIDKSSSANGYSYNLIGFGCKYPVVLYGTATTGECQATCTFPAITSNLKGMAKMYQIIIPGADGKNQTYYVNAKGAWRTYNTSGQAMTPTKVTVPAGCGVWFVNPNTSATVPTVTVGSVVQ